MTSDSQASVNAWEDVPLRLAYSPCPNDTFIFHAWVRGLLPGAPAVEEELEDIDGLNQRAAGEEAEVV